MAIPVPEIDTQQIPPELVSSILEQIKARIAHEFPHADVRRGVFHDLVLYGTAVLEGAQRARLHRLLKNMTLADILADPESADRQSLDELLANFRVTRKGGAHAQGVVLVVVDRKTIFTVPAGVSFHKGSLGFRVAAAHTVKLHPENVQLATDRVLTPYGPNQWSFTIPVEAEQAGSAYNIRKDSLLTTAANIPGFVTAFALQDFVGGADEESNTELLRRLQEGISARAMHNRSMMEALLRDIHPQTVANSIIGFGDAEMLRDKHSVFGVATGGKVDWYIKTALRPIVEEKTFDATLIEKRPDGRGIWQIGIGRDAAPGFYDVLSIRPMQTTGQPYQGSLQILESILLYDNTPIPGELMPEIHTPVEAAYTRFRTAVLQFIDHLTPVVDVPLQTVRPYRAMLRYMPDIARLQSRCASRDFRHAAGDILVRAPVPAFTSIAFTIQARPFTTLPDLGRIRDTIAKEINRMAFVGRIVGSEIADIVYDFVPSNVSVVEMDLFWIIRAADGSLHRQRSSDSLVVPYLPEILVTPRTVAFFIEPDDIRINLKVVVT